MKHVRGSAWILSAVTILLVAPTVALAQPNIERMDYGIPKITGASDYDALYGLGVVHAQDRFFQMDMQRRVFSGQAAELFGEPALAQDIELRTLGLRRAAVASWPAVSVEVREWLTAYADGVNSYLMDATLPLPPEYGALELTRESIPPWTPVDSLTIAKGLAFGLSFGLEDINYTVAYMSFMAAGAAVGFNGAALFFEDLYRTAPFDPAVSIPDFMPKGAATAAEVGAGRTPEPVHYGPHTLRLAEAFVDRVREIPIMRQALEHSAEQAGSNWWVIDGSLSASGHPILANDPHLSLSQPSVFYEAQLVVTDPEHPMDVFGVTFPGAPMVVQGCNSSLCWGSTVHPMDVTDVYQERLALSTSDQLPIATYFDGHWELVQRIHQSYRVNQLDGTPDNLAAADVPKGAGGITFVVPRRNFGPIVAVDSSNLYRISGLSVQYTGWGPTREADAFRLWARATTVEEFEEGVQYFDFGSQNWSVATVDGDIAYFTSAEMPLREDLQTMMAPDGMTPPFFIRDGTHTLAHEWMALENPQPGQAIPYEILPAAEMPHLVNPERGYIINANNDPVGSSLDNNSLNQLRPGGGLYYLSPGYASGFRMGRLQSLFDEAIAAGEPLTMADMEAFQANNQLLDAEFFAPLIVAAYDKLMAGSGLPPGVNDNVGAAVEKLRGWDFSTPTGIAAGFDPGDDPFDLPEPAQAEIDASVAASIYAVWRGQMVQGVIDAPLAQMGLRHLAPPSDLAMTALRNLVDNFTMLHGFGASGVQFIPDANLEGAMMAALSAALDLLQGDAFAAAFAYSTEVTDYRWGRLHRIRYSHPLGGPFNIPPAGGVMDLSAQLPGVARSGGFGAVDASSHGARADAANEFMFGHGPARRFVGHLAPDGILIHQTTPGGVSGVMGSPHQADALMLWLTNHYHERTMDPAP